MEFLARFSNYSPAEKQDGIVGLGNVMRTVGSLLLMCDSRDLGVSIGSRHGDATPLSEPDLFLYDTYPGGIGQSEPLFRMRAALVEKSLELMKTCQCNEGCPSCVGAPGEVGELAKEVAINLATSIAGIKEAMQSTTAAP